MALQSAAFSRGQHPYWLARARECQEALRLLRLYYMTEDEYAGVLCTAGLADGRYAWTLHAVKRIVPEFARGKLGLWEWEG